MAPSLASFSPARIRSYILRLPLLTRVILILIVVVWVLELQRVWDVAKWCALIPAEIGFQSSTQLPVNFGSHIHVSFQCFCVHVGQ